MKRIALFLAVLMLVFSLAACGNETEKDPEKGTAADPTTGVEETTEALEGCKHQYEQEVVTEVSCVEGGTVQYTCTVCKESYTEEVPATGHQIPGVSCGEAGVCEKCGEVMEAARGHEVEDGFCVHCGEKVAQEVPTEETQS